MAYKKQFPMSCIYIGGGFLKSQLLYILPVIHGFASKTPVSTLVFDSESFKAVLELIDEPIINNLIKRYALVEASRPTTAKPFEFIYRLIYGIRKFGVAKSLALLSVHSTNLLRNVSWLDLQVRHATWDSICLTLKDGSLRVSLIKRFKLCLTILAHYGYGARLSSLYEFKSGVFAHGVYYTRSIIAAFRENRVYCFIDALKCIYRLPLTFDISHSTFPAFYWNEYIQRINIDKVQHYWEGRLQGNSRYADAVLAAHGEQKWEGKDHGVLFLHIFKDSPFLSIDVSRIFPDYIEWVRFSLTCIIQSQGKWVIRMHPSQELWGEEQSKWISELLRLCGLHSLPKNISLVGSSVSVNDLLKGASKILTYHGTVHLEAACHGIKPIVISRCSLHDCDMSAVHKPSNLEDYADLIFDSNLQRFRLEPYYRERAKSILYVRENLLGFEKCINSITLYRNADSSMKHKDYIQVLEGLEANIDRLKKAGFSLNQSNHTLSLDQYRP